MKKTLALLLALGMILAVGSASAARTIQLGQIDSNIMEDPYYLYAFRFGEKLSELSGGEFTIDIIGDAQLGGEAAMLEGMSIQTVDAAIISNFTFSSFVPEFCTFDMPTSKLMSALYHYLSMGKTLHESFSLARDSMAQTTAEVVATDVFDEPQYCDAFILIDAVD